MKTIFITICLCTLYLRQASAKPAGPVVSFIQTNFVGLPVIHAEQKWDFNPDVSLRRRRQFVGLHGDKGDKLIERLGLGIDGFAEERLEKQRRRDEGHLGGLNYFQP